MIIGTGQLRQRFSEFIDPVDMMATPEFRIVEDFLNRTGRTRIGWHYIMDLTWIYRQARAWPPGTEVLDAGGGNGPTQYLLCELGFNVTNVDLRLPEPDDAPVRRYGMTRRVLASHRDTEYSRHLAALHPGRQRVVRSGVLRRLSALFRRRTRDYARVHDEWRREAGADSRPVGRLKWLVGNLSRMPELADGRFDALVSLSALEHVPIAELGAVVGEVTRVLKPDGRWAVTTSATDAGESWFHEPSQGWCFSTSDLERTFAAQHIVRHDAGAMLRHYRDSGYLERNLADFYRDSGRNGMPYGIWDPAYIPVGIRA